MSLEKGGELNPGVSHQDFLFKIWKGDRPHVSDYDFDTIQSDLRLLVGATIPENFSTKLGAGSLIWKRLTGLGYTGSLFLGYEEKWADRFGSGTQRVGSRLTGLANCVIEIIPPFKGTVWETAEVKVAGVTPDTKGKQRLVGLTFLQNPEAEYKTIEINFGIQERELELWGIPPIENVPSFNNYVTAGLFTERMVEIVNLDNYGRDTQTKVMRLTTANRSFGQTRLWTESHEENLVFYPTSYKTFGRPPLSFHEWRVGLRQPDTQNASKMKESWIDVPARLKIPPTVSRIP